MAECKKRGGETGGDPRSGLIRFAALPLPTPPFTEGPAKDKTGSSTFLQPRKEIKMERRLKTLTCLQARQTTTPFFPSPTLMYAVKVVF